MVTRGWQNIRGKGAAVAAVAGIGALLAGCSTIGRPESTASLGTRESGIAVTCEPNQRALVRQVLVNGTPQSQVECTSGFASAGTPGSFGPVPAAYAPSAVPVSYGYAQGPIAPVDNTRFVRAVPAREVVTSDVAPRRVSYQRVPERVVTRRTRSVQKSAIIIGSSAGVGAGIGAAAGGKKGALVGALLGGGGATLWDQMTRHRQ